MRRSLRLAIYARDRFTCVYCGDTGTYPLRGLEPRWLIDRDCLTLEHVIPRSQGGKHTPDNLVTACTGCNSARVRPDRRARERIRRALRRPVVRDVGLWLERAGV